MTHWLLLRGLTREAGHWGAFGAQLAEALGGAAVTALDLPGAGVHHAQACPARIGDIAERCRASLGRQPGDEPVALLGLSMGGLVVAEWARRHPREVCCGVMVNTSAGGVSPPWQRMRLGQWPAVLGIATRWSHGGEVERGILGLTSSDPGRHGRELARWVDLRTAHPVLARNALRQLVAAARYRAPGSPPAVPLLAVCSEGDRLVHARCTKDLASRWGLALRVHPSAGHDLPLDDGPWLAATVARWAREPASSA